MPARVFVDTNIWIYGLTTPADGEETEKHQLTVKLIDKTKHESQLFVSTQVINEFHWNMTKKFGLPDNNANHLVKTNISTISTITDVTYSTYESAFELRSKYSLSFWDSLIVASALLSHCESIYSELICRRPFCSQKRMPKCSTTCPSNTISAIFSQPYPAKAQATALKDDTQVRKSHRTLA